MTTDYLTRHSSGFSLTDGQLDPTRCPFTRFGFADYPQRRSALAAIVGTDQFLWAVEKTTGFCHYEQIKPIEWEVRVRSDRLLGYVDDENWFAFLEGKSSNLVDCFTKERPTVKRFSVLLPFPLQLNERIKRRTYWWVDPDHAQIAEEVTFDPTSPA